MQSKNDEFLSTRNEKMSYLILTHPHHTFGVLPPLYA